MPSIVLEVMENYQPYDAAKKVLLMLAAYSDEYGAHVFPSLDTIARVSGVSRRQVQNCLLALEAKGQLAIIRRKEPGKNARNSYTVLCPWRVPAQKSRAMIPGIPAQKSRAIQSALYTSLKPKREERSGSGEIPRQIRAEDLPQREQIQVTPDEAERWWTPGSYHYEASLSGSTPVPPKRRRLSLAEREARIRDFKDCIAKLEREAARAGDKPGSIISIDITPEILETWKRERPRPDRRISASSLGNALLIAGKEWRRDG